MADVKRTVPMTRRGEAEFQVGRLEPVGGPVPFSLHRLFIGRVVVSYRVAEGPVTGSGRSVRLAGARQCTIDVHPPLLFERFVMGFDKLGHQSPGLARELWSAV